MRLKQTAALSLATFGIVWGVANPLRASVVSNGMILQTVPGARVLRNGKAIASEAGMLLYPSDRLQTIAGETLWIQCDDLTLQILPGGGVRGNGCPLASEPKCSEDAVKCPNRGEGDPWDDTSIPYTIYPRRTGLLNPQPLLRWNPVAIASRYTVTVRGEGMEWTVETDKSQIVYSGTPLQPGGRYLLIVTADTGQSSIQEPSQGGGMGFWLLDEFTARQVRDTEAQISQTIPETTARTLAIAHLYLKSGLVSEGIERLEAWLASGGESASVHCLLNNLYKQDLLLGIPAKQHQEQAETLGRSCLEN